MSPFKKESIYQKQNSEILKDSIDDSSVDLKGANHHNQTGQYYPPGVDNGLQLTARKKKKKNEGLDPTSKGRELCQQTMSMEEDLYEPCMRLQSWMIS